MINAQDRTEERYVTGRRWLGEDLVTGRYVEHWGTGAKAVRIELPDGERVSLVAETVSDVEPAEQLLARFGVTPIESDTGRHELTEVFAAVEPAEQTAIGRVSGTLDMPVVEPDVFDQQHHEYLDQLAEVLRDHTSDEDAYDEFVEEQLDELDEDEFGLYADEPEHEPEPGWVRRNLTKQRIPVLCLVIGILVGSGIGWWVR